METNKERAERIASPYEGEAYHELVRLITAALDEKDNVLPEYYARVKAIFDKIEAENGPQQLSK